MNIHLEPTGSALIAHASNWPDNDPYGALTSALEAALRDIGVHPTSVNAWYRYQGGIHVAFEAAGRRYETVAIPEGSSFRFELPSGGPGLSYHKNTQ